MLALLGLRGAPPARGLRLVFEPAFHRSICLTLDAAADPPTLEVHALPRAASSAVFWDGGRYLRPDPDALLPWEHPADLRELPAEIAGPLQAAIDGIGPEDLGWRVEHQWRDGMVVRCELFGPEGTVRFGDGAPAGDGPPGYEALLRAACDAARAVVEDPELQRDLEALERFLPSTRGRSTRPDQR